MEDVASEFNLLEGPIPQVQWEVFVRRAHGCDEVIFEGSHGSFGCVGSVHAGGRFLVAYGFSHHELDEFLGAFVVQIVEQGSSALCH